jgi:hypothetical protein
MLNPDGGAINTILALTNFRCTVSVSAAKSVRTQSDFYDSTITEKVEMSKSDQICNVRAERLSPSIMRTERSSDAKG